MTSSRQRRRVFRFIATCGALILAVFASEWLATNVLEIHSTSQPNRYIRLRERAPLQEWQWEFNEALLENTDGLEGRSFRMATDADGNILPHFRSNSPEHTLLFLGGSTTECANVSETHRFPHLAGQLLEEKGFPNSTINSANIGNHSRHSLNILLNKGLSIEPDLVVMMHNINDLSILRTEGSYFNDHPTRSLIATEDLSLTSHLKGTFKSILPGLGQLLENSAAAILDTPTAIKNHPPKSLAVDKITITDQFSKSLRTFLAICFANDIKPVLMTQANRFTDTPAPLIGDAWGPQGAQSAAYRSFIDIYHALNDVIRSLSEQYNVLLIDLAAEIPQDRSHLYDSIHLNETGSKLAAQIIAREIGTFLQARQSSREP